MSRLTRYINKTLSFRLSLTVIAALAILLIVALFIMFYFSRKAMKEEALNDASQTLEATVNRIDNILLNVEQSTGNMYWKMMSHVKQRAKLEIYAQRLVDDNPYIIDSHFVWCADSPSVNTEIYGWITPQHHQEEGEGEAVTTFRLPLYDGQKVVGVFDVDMSLQQLSKIVIETKPSPNSFSVLLGRDGNFIVSPDSSYLNESAFEVAEKMHQNAELEAINAMISGEAGYRYVRVKGKDYYVFFKPFVRADVPGRAQNDLGWSAAIVYPENDIFGEYNHLLHIVLVIAVVGLLLLFISCRLFIHRQLVPLRELEKSAQRIAQGSYDEPIPDSRKQDEVGRLHKHFQKMQQSLVMRMGELQHASEILKERGEVLQTAYEQAQTGDRMKTNFLYNMSDQMMSPVSDIHDSVMTISEQADKLPEEEVDRLVDTIQEQGGKITALLNQLISESEKVLN